MKWFATILALAACVGCNESKLGGDGGNATDHPAASSSNAEAASVAPPIPDSGPALTAVDASTDADMDQMFDAALDLLEDAATVIHANEANCDAMGQRLQEYHREHGKLVARVEDVYENVPGDEKRAIQARYRTRFKTAWAKLRPGVLKCKDNPTVNDAVHKLWSNRTD